MDKCIACGACAEKCPKKVPDEYDAGMGTRKAIYVKYAQAVPLKYAIDPAHCLKLTRGKCGNCEKVCPAGAIRYDDHERELKLHVGAVILAEGVETYDPAVHDTYGYCKNPNVVTSLEFERILSASGPYRGHMVRPSDQKDPKKIAWVQCVGSRDEHLEGRGYCSGVCCTYAVKEAMLAKEHANGDLDAAVFYIDIRTNGKDFEKYYNRARYDQGVRFIKSKVTYIQQDEATGMSRIRYIDEQGLRKEEAFDMVVLSVGLGVTPQVRDLANKLGIEVDRYGFVSTGSFRPVQTSRRGIFVAGACQSPKDIPTSVVDSSAAAGVAGSLLTESRFTLTKTEEAIPARDIRGESVRIGVFVCRCGTNIAGTVDVPAVVKFARGLPGVVFAEDNMFSCSQDSQNKMSQVIKEKGLNRVVVAACTPKTHEPLFQETLVNAGLNKYLFEMVNIRNQCAWVHKDDPDAATLKAKDLVRMGVAKAQLLEPLTEPVLHIEQTAVVVGGGVAGMEAARNLAEQGYHTFLVERDKALGGHARFLHKTWRGEDVREYLHALIEAVEKDYRIKVFLGAEITEVEGFVGNFRTQIRQAKESRILEHGITILAAGASEYQPEDPFLKESPAVTTGLAFQKMLREKDFRLAEVRTAVFLQCYGSRIPERPYCSKVCCTQSITSALEFKKRDPARQVFILYRDMRPYGLREDLYREARRKGVIFVRYQHDKDLRVDPDGKGVCIRFTDCVLGREMAIPADILVLASAIVPESDNALSRFYKVSQNEDGFFAEAHVKLRPVDFATDGVFVCGLAHSPKPIDESIAQAQAAAARAVTLLSAKTIAVSGTVAWVDPVLCSRCGVCIAVCPYSAPRFDEKTGKAAIESTICKGCGLCTASCRSEAIHLKGFETSQIMGMIEKGL
ncbi:MAG: heterodisulfide reductase [Desulfococcus sp. 4484_242]|nr:MAG: heterodisulfide reductase [Desulfococcus sp. 4484_242]